MAETIKHDKFEFRIYTYIDTYVSLCLFILINYIHFHFEMNRKLIYLVCCRCVTTYIFHLIFLQ